MVDFHCSTISATLLEKYSTKNVTILKVHKGISPNMMGLIEGKL